MHNIDFNNIIVEQFEEASAESFESYGLRLIAFKYEDEFEKTLTHNQKIAFNKLMDAYCNYHGKRYFELVDFVLLFIKKLFK